MSNKACAALLLIAFFIPTLTYAGTVQLPRTGQTICWDASGNEMESCDDTGQDGDIQAGAAWPSPRFTNPDGSTPVNGSIVLDRLTGLEWVKDGGTPTVGLCSGGTKTWQGALDYVKCLNTNTNGYLGYEDWRLPNVNELESLVNAGEPNLAYWLKFNGFMNVQADIYWSSSSVAYNPGYAWFVHMWSGYVDYSGEITYDEKKAKYYVWPVRNGQSTSSVQLPRTGQTICWDASGNEMESCDGTGQDGEIQAGVAWPDPRFKDNRNGTMRDRLTGLVWTENANTPVACDEYRAGAQQTWQGALDYVKCLNRNGYLGYEDWRLPNRRELLSLVNYGRPNPSTWLKLQGFLDVNTYYYWSSSSYPGDPTRAWFVDMWTGVADYYDMNDKDKNAAYHVWPVRTGALQGDIDGNRIIDLADAILVLQALAGLTPGDIRSDYAASLADVNGDNAIGLEELIFILQHLAGLRTEQFPSISP